MSDLLEPLLTPEDVSRWLALEDTRNVYELTRLRAPRRLNAIKVGKYLRFRRSDVEAWLAEGATTRTKRGG